MYEVYRHYNRKHYIAVGTALHSETLEPYRCYRALYENPKSKGWIRPLEMFDGYHSSGEKRFTLVGRVGRAAPEDELELLMFSYDAWGAGRSHDEYVRDIISDNHHIKGVRWFITDTAGIKIAFLNLLQISRTAVGFASIATSPTHTGKGFASLLVSAVKALTLLEEPMTRFLPEEDLKGDFYKQIGESAEKGRE